VRNSESKAHDSGLIYTRGPPGSMRTVCYSAVIVVEKTTNHEYQQCRRVIVSVVGFWSVTWVPQLGPWNCATAAAK